MLSHWWFWHMHLELVNTNIQSMISSDLLIYTSCILVPFKRDQEGHYRWPGPQVCCHTSHLFHSLTSALTHVELQTQDEGCCVPMELRINIFLTLIQNDFIMNCITNFEQKPVFPEHGHRQCQWASSAWGNGCRWLLNLLGLIIHLQATTKLEAKLITAQLV